MPATPDDLDLKIAICFGVGLTGHETAEVCDVSYGTITNRKRDQSEHFDKWRTFAEMVADRTVSRRVAAGKAAMKAEDKIVDRLDRALQITDRAIQKLEDLGDDASLKDLLAGHKILTEWVADYAASRAPKRVAIEGGVQHEHVFLLDETVSALTAFQNNLRQLLPAIAATSEIEEAEVVQ